MGAAVKCPKRGDSQPNASPSPVVRKEDNSFRVPQKRTPAEAKKERHEREISAQGSTLNPDAEPFYPSQMNSTPAARCTQPTAENVIRAMPSMGRNDDRATDDWMWYLSQKFKQPSEATRFTNTAGSLSHFRTDEYMDMLKSSQSVGSAARTKRTPEEKTKSVCSGSANNALLPRKSKILDPLLSGHKRLPKIGERYDGEQREQVLKTQDDFALERCRRDCDLSEAAYWSDCDVDNCILIRRTKGASSCASCHRLTCDPESLAERVPAYVMQDLSTELDRKVGILLYRLRLFGEPPAATNATAEGKSSELMAKRRYVIGVKEVLRRARQNVIRCAVIAPDITERTEPGGIENRVREFLEFAYQSNVPVIFALTRAGIGRALGKQLNVSIIGLLDVSGAQTIFQEAMSLAEKHRAAWLDRKLQNA